MAHTSSFPRCPICRASKIRQASDELDRLGFGGASIVEEPLTGYRGAIEHCPCAAIQVFRKCFWRYRRVEMQWHRPRYTRFPGGTARGVLGYPSLEFRADFELIARRTLRGLEYLCFRQFLMGGELSEPIQAKVGRALWDVEPYPVYP